MARHTGPTCKLARRVGQDLNLKSAVKPLDHKCRLKTPPGGFKAGAGRRGNDYLIHLREKQKLRRIYGVLERQFRLYYQRAARARAATGEALIQILESRLDNVVYRLGFAVTRAQARQFVNHGLVQVDGKRVDIPSYQLRPGQTVAMSERGRELLYVKSALAQGRPAPDWMDLDAAAFSGVFRERPAREAVAMEINENLVVEFYSK